ncbi:MAG: zinc ribbon domain-containing protein [Armatimonas sp.]
MNHCPNCGKPVDADASRCAECGHRLTLARVAFDLTDDALPVTESDVWRRLLGATLPFWLSMVWVGFLWLGLLGGGSAQDSVATGSLIAAPILRILLPLICWKALEQRQPAMAGGFRNALMTVWQLILAHLLIAVIGIPVIIALLVLGILATCLGAKTPDSFTALTPFQTTPGMAMATLLVQGMLAGLLPVRVVRENGRLRISKAAGKSVFLAMFLLALAWWLPGGWNRIPLVIANILVAVMAFRTIQKSEALTQPTRLPLQIFVGLVVLVALTLSAPTTIATVK